MAYGFWGVGRPKHPKIPPPPPPDLGPQENFWRKSICVYNTLGYFIIYLGWELSPLLIIWCSDQYTYTSCVYVCVCGFLGGKGGGGTPHRHGHKESYTDLKFEKFDLRVGLEPMTSWILVWRSTTWAIRRSDESSLGILRCTIFLTKFNHLYLGTGCVCFFGREGGNTP